MAKHNEGLIRDLLAEVKAFRATILYYMAKDNASGDDEGYRLKSLKMKMLDALIAEAETK